MLVLLLLVPLAAAAVRGRVARDEAAVAFGETCLGHFTVGLPDFVLDTDASVQNGATFLSSPAAARGRDCVRACCKEPACNLALVEQSPDGGEDGVRACFLLDCLYEQAFVCKFARKAGFLNYVKRDVYDAYVSMREKGEGDDLPPKARAGMDLKVQPGEAVILRGAESSDDHGIVSYDWKHLSGDSSVVLEKQGDDQVEVSNLQTGIYVFQLTVTDTVNQQDTTNITITVLNAEQTEDYCLAPSKVGWCRGSFPRWFYNPESQRCEKFTFGGCKPNKNNYVREEECNLACKNVQGPVGRRQQPDALEFNNLRKINGTSEQGHCVDLPDTGLCQESITRWYYNPFAQKCSRFTYGGCDGNKNNFEHEEDCMKSCAGVTKSDVIGQRLDFYEIQQASLSAFEVAIAVLLGICIMIVLVIIGYYYLKNRKKNSRRRQPATATNSTLSTTEDTEHLVYNSTTKPI
ncbi:PREDICTED: kunitz-type protease inhibitor 1 isoform X2 [Gavialis gangeticus]|uniref:kunitz-type protease inhibitor 1 isoform X2 n=1 Tax=Gavialis gangeticus TaxID=94835 RepID=UPI00092FB198|nr:PREDICTED: kunitz-type protease inhibitor 1 isoform X2 [Gavialis gangeticus]